MLKAARFTGYSAPLPILLPRNPSLPGQQSQDM